SGGQHAAHVDLLDVGGGDPGALHGSGQGMSAQLGRRNVPENPLKSTDRRARGAQNDDVGHRDFLRGLRPARSTVRMSPTGPREPGHATTRGPPRLLMRTLAIDFGERRIGLALSDADGRFALPWKVLERRSDESAIA